MDCYAIYYNELLQSEAKLNELYYNIIICAAHVQLTNMRYILQNRAHMTWNWKQFVVGMLHMLHYNPNKVDVKTIWVNETINLFAGVKDWDFQRQGHFSRDSFTNIDLYAENSSLSSTSSLISGMTHALINTIGLITGYTHAQNKQSLLIG